MITKQTVDIVMATLQYYYDYECPFKLSGGCKDSNIYKCERCIVEKVTGASVGQYNEAAFEYGGETI